MAIEREHLKWTKLLFYRRFYNIAYNILRDLVLNVIIDTRFAFPFY